MRPFRILWRRSFKLAVAPPTGGTIADRQREDRARLGRHTLPGVKPGGQLTQRAVAPTDRLLAPPGNAAAAGAEAHRLFKSRAAMLEERPQLAAEPVHVVGRQHLAREAAAADAIQPVERIRYTRVHAGGSQALGASLRVAWKVVTSG